MGWIASVPPPYNKDDYYNREIPLLSGIESTMAWLDSAAIRHQWTVDYPSDPLISPSGFAWKRFYGEELSESVIPQPSPPFNLDGYPMHVSGFWEQFKPISKFVGRHIGLDWDNRPFNNVSSNVSWSGNAKDYEYPHSDISVKRDVSTNLFDYGQIIKYYYETFIGKGTAQLKGSAPYHLEISKTCTWKFPYSVTSEDIICSETTFNGGTYNGQHCQYIGFATTCPALCNNGFIVDNQVDTFDPADPCKNSYYPLPGAFCGLGTIKWRNYYGRPHYETGNVDVGSCINSLINWTPISGVYSSGTLGQYATGSICIRGNSTVNCTMPEIYVEVLTEEQAGSTPPYGYPDKQISLSVSMTEKIPFFLFGKYGTFNAAPQIVKYDLEKLFGFRGSYDVSGVAIDIQPTGSCRTPLSFDSVVDYFYADTSGNYPYNACLEFGSSPPFRLDGTIIERIAENSRDTELINYQPATPGNGTQNDLGDAIYSCGSGFYDKFTLSQGFNPVIQDRDTTHDSLILVNRFDGKQVSISSVNFISTYPRKAGPPSFDPLNNRYIPINLILRSGSVEVSGVETRIDFDADPVWDISPPFAAKESTGYSFLYCSGLTYPWEFNIWESNCSPLISPSLCDVATISKPSTDFTHIWFKNHDDCGGKTVFYSYSGAFPINRTLSLSGCTTSITGGTQRYGFTGDGYRDVMYEKRGYKGLITSGTAFTPGFFDIMLDPAENLFGQKNMELGYV